MNFDVRAKWLSEVIKAHKIECSRIDSLLRYTDSERGDDLQQNAIVEGNDVSKEIEF